MKKILCIVVLWLPSIVVSANGRYAGDVALEAVRQVDGWAFFSVSPQPSGTCNASSQHLKFSVTSREGQARLSVLLTAKAMGANIDVWYLESPNPSADTCGWSDVAVARGVRIR